MKHYLDLLTNRITMYRLIVYLLVALMCVAVLLSIFGVLDFDPFAMILGGVVLGATSVGVNALFAYMFSVPRNSESALISALILFFIFTPPDSPQGAIGMAFVAAIAAASKYLLVWKGRHIFNPAASAAVISGFIGLGFASWWVATGPLIIVTALLGVIILYKTRRLRMGLLYVGVSITAIILTTLLQGRDVMVILPQIATSWPLVFFACFMLSEPLTMPPRKYQRYLFAAGIAIIANTQWHIGSVFTSPEIALAIGNVYAFWCGQRGAIKLTLIARKQLSGGQIEYTFEPSRPLKYRAGQYIEIQLPHKNSDRRGVRRTFTIASAPGSKYIKLGIRHYQPSSTFKQALQTMEIGKSISATGIYGDFLLPSNRSEKLLLVAGGIGITPFRSHLQWLLDNNQQRDGILLYSVREMTDAIYHDILMAQEHGIKLHVISGPVTGNILRQYVPDITSRHVFVSGPPPMVDAVEAEVKRQGAKTVSKDHFNGY